MKACDSSIRMCDSIRVPLHTIVMTNNYYEPCARSGVIPDPATFRPPPPWKKVCNDPSWHKAIFFVASHLRLPYTRKWHAPAMQRIRGHIIGVRIRTTTGEELTPRSSTQHIDNSSNTHASSDPSFFTIVRKKRINKIIIIFSILKNIVEETLL